jgi:ribosomal protein S18 acetylase RimI-like enzyme
MKEKIYNLLKLTIDNGNGIDVLDDLEAYVDKIVENACIISIVENNKLLGFLAYYASDLTSKKAFLSAVIIAPDAPKLGYGRRLVDFCLADLVFKGFKKCGAEVNELNTAALNICKKTGFTELYRQGSSVFLEKIIE